MGAKPVFSDINPDTYNLDPLKIEEKITSKTRAIIPVDYTGQSAELFKIREIAKKYNLFIIEDAAHSLGAEICDSNGVWHKVGLISDLTTFSFHPVKHITTAEGGMICTNDESLYNRLLMFRTHGITRDKKFLENADVGNWYYEQQLLGYNYRISDIQAALGISQLKKLDGFIKRRREIADKYNKAFGQSSLNERVTLPYQSQNTKSSYHIYVLKFNTEKIGKDRDKLFQGLANRNIGVNVHYIPVYYHPYYRSLGYEKGICPVAERLYEEIITLPLHPGMTNEEVDYVIESVKEECMN